MVKSSSGGRPTRLIAFDLDGTLLDPSRRITRYSIDVLTRARAVGYRLAAVTGRSRWAADSVLSPVPAVEYAVCSNGASVLDRRTGAILRYTPLSGTLLTKLHRFAGKLTHRVTRVRELSRARHSWLFAVSLDSWKMLASQRGGGVNELLIALAANVWSRYARSTGMVHDTVRVEIPVDVRGSEGHQAGANVLKFAVVTLDDPPRCLRDLASLRQLSTSSVAAAARDSEGIVWKVRRLLPVALRGRLVHRIASWPHAVATNVRVPTTLALDAEPCERVFALAPVTGAALTFALTTYLDTIHVAVNADLGRVTHPHQVDRALREVLRGLGWTEVEILTRYR